MNLQCRQRQHHTRQVVVLAAAAAAVAPQPAKGGRRRRFACLRTQLQLRGNARNRPQKRHNNATGEDSDCRPLGDVDAKQLVSSRRQTYIIPVTYLLFPSNYNLINSISLS